MALINKLTEFFSHSAREKGKQLFDSKAVDLDAFAADEIAGLVGGGSGYQANLRRAKNKVYYSCECDHFTLSLEPCKHVYATLLAADAAHKLDEWDTSRELDFDPDPDSIDDGARTNHLEDASSFHAALRTIQPKKAKKSGLSAQDRETAWKKSLANLRNAMVRSETAHQTVWPPGREVLYVIDVPRTLDGGGLVVDVAYRERKKDGNWSKPKRQGIRSDEVPAIPDPLDRELLSMLMGARSNAYSGYYYSGYDYGSSASSFRLGESMLRPAVSAMCRTGRCSLRILPDSDAPSLSWDPGEPWQFWVTAAKDEKTGTYILTGELRRGEQRMPLHEPVMLVQGGLLFTHDTAAALEDGGAFPWIVMLREKREIVVPAKHRDELLAQMMTLPHLPRLELPEELRVQETAVAPKPRLRVFKPRRNGYSMYSNDRLHAEISFDYDGQVVRFEEPGRGIFQSDRNRLLLRDEPAEREAIARLRSLGFRYVNTWNSDGAVYELAANSLPGVIRKLTAENWFVEADGKLYRQPGKIQVEVTSGIDWFELHGTADFGDQQVKLPELLAALRRGEKTVQLGDGTFGVLPEQWLAKYGLLADMGTADEDHIKFGKSQVGLLDALLASQPEATCDAVFEQARDRMRNFEGVRAVDAPPGFTGTLRPYQREGLGWMEFLRDFSFGGCLADDMGLGKTVQVLALLEARRQARESAPAESAPPETAPRGLSLVVAPRSLVFNWREEAAKFAPNLKVLDHTGLGRAKAADAFAGYDLILTTYGTLRNDAAFLKDVPFDYVVLDEAQAIKNAQSESAKAVRLLQGSHRLALSGTPVQNHLGELWSLFEFLNPGMLGTARAFQATGAGARVVEEETRQLLSRALRPFILRRTKGQVAKDLPERSEQTIHCELDATQRKMYDDLKEHYRRSLLSRIEREGIRKAKIQILEALLRLRQAACHPGLIDKSKTGQSSAKLDSLLANLTELREENHKVLVFSQFTSLLAIVRDRLDKEKITYEYLDGRTRNRAACVERFQTDPDCKLFLISLKAGGLGLNLTAAEYVFLLDPWWNPAVEAQAIDRAHRIGQTRQVFAYRLIAKDTVEEKVLQLQQTKRDLADAIINAENSLIGKLGREDLELLLS